MWGRGARGVARLVLLWLSLYRSQNVEHLTIGVIEMRVALAGLPQLET